MLALYTRQAREWSELGLGDLGEIHKLIPEVAADSLGPDLDQLDQNEGDESEGPSDDVQGAASGGSS